MKIENQFVQNPPFPRNYAAEMLIIDRGEGVYLYDNCGKKYLDMGSGIAVNALGYGRQDFADLISNQAHKLLHVSNLYATEPALELAQKMTTGTNFAAVHFGNSGTEANEAALKYARLYSKSKKGASSFKFLSFKNGFHGRTMGALSVTPNEKYQAPFAPLIPGTETAEFNNVDSLSILDKSFAAVIVEVIQGEGGIIQMSEEFAKALRSKCDELDIILIADEVQTGMGRTGYFYASEMLALKPDIITLSKPLAGGLPLSATLIPAKINELLVPGHHGSTFGGGPVTTSLASHLWDIISNHSFLEQVKDTGNFLFNELLKMYDEYDLFDKPRGCGLLQGLPMKDTKLISTVLKKAQEKGMLLLSAGGNVIRFAPPLIITKEEITIAIDTLRSIIDSIKDTIGTGV